MTMTENQEAALLLQLSQDNQDSFRAIYDRYWEQLYQAAYRRLGDAQLAEDVVQEVFLRLWNGRKQLKIQYLGAYLQQAVRNEVLDRVSRTRSPSRFYEIFESVLLVSDSPEDLLRNKELMALVAQYIATLPRKRREVFLLFMESKLNTKEIADRLKVSQKTVQNQIAVTLAGLRNELKLFVAIAITQQF